jgi:hypothetical protein
MNKPKKKDLAVSWEEVEDPDFAEHLRRVFKVIMRSDSGIEERSAEDPNPQNVQQTHNKDD